MDFGDFLTATGTEGTRRLRILTGTIGAVLGGFFGALFSGYILFGLTLVVVFGLVFAWEFFVKGA